MSCRSGAARRAPRLLRRRRDGDQGAGVDGAGVRAARVLLPRDRPQPARRRALRARWAWCSSTTSPTCPPGAPIMLSAHGSAPEVVAAARATGQLRRRLGVPARHQGPPRGQGARRQGLPHRLRRPRGPRGGRRHDGRRARRDHRVESVAEVDALPGLRRAGRAARPDDAVAPRLGRRRRRASRERFPDVWTPGRSDLCFATTNRQSALMAMAPRCDAIVVIGSANSSNTRALEKLASEAGCASVYPRQHASTSCPTTSRGVVGVTAGASAPEELVDAVIARLAPDRRRRGGRVTDEDEYFPPPRNIRDLQAADRGRGDGGCRRIADRSALQSTTAALPPATCSRRSAPDASVSERRRRSARRRRASAGSPSAQPSPS